MLDRAYGILDLKALDEDKREIEGIASTISTDRDGDILIPEGAVIKTPFPFLYHHDRYQPIGEVYEAKVTKRGIEIKARLAKVDAPSQLAARLEEAWASIKSRLIRGISVGFRPLKTSLNEDTGGYIFDKWEMLECSAVTIPANQDATITRIKSVDTRILTALGKDKMTVKSVSKPSGATEKFFKQIKLNPKEGEMSISEKIKAFEAELTAKKAKRDSLMEKSLEANETFDEAANEEFDTLDSEIKALEAHLSKAKMIEEERKKSAKVVDGSNEKSALESRTTSKVFSQVKAAEKLDKGIQFARYVMCQVAAKGNQQLALEIAKNHYGSDSNIANVLDFQSKGGNFEQMMMLKTAVIAGNTLNSTWAAPLVQYQDFAGDFIEYLRPRTIIGRFGNDGIPGLRRIPFNVRIKGQTSGGAGYWVGEGKPKPVTKFDFDDVELRWAKAASIAVITEELVRFSDPSAEMLVRDALAAAVIERLDTDFVDPAKVAVSNVSPASITNTASAIPSTGTDADAVRCDVQALWVPFIAANNAPRSAVYIMNSTIALALSLMLNPLGQPEFPGITINGGTFLGVPVIVSDYVPSGIVILANASDIWFADDGQVTVDVSREASLQMLDTGGSGAGAPTNDSVTPTATSLVSMFQTNSVAVRAERYINWQKRRASAVQYLEDVEWGSCASA